MRKNIISAFLLMILVVQNVKAETIKTEFVCQSYDLLNHYVLNILQGNPSLEFGMSGACRAVPEKDYQVISKQLLILPKEYIGVYAVEIMLAPNRYAYAMWADPAKKAEQQAHYNKVIAQRKAAEEKAKEVEKQKEMKLVQEQEKLEKKEKTLWGKTKKGLKFINDVMSY